MANLQIENDNVLVGKEFEIKCKKLKILLGFSVAIIVALLVVLAVFAFSGEDKKDTGDKEENKHIETAIEMVEDKWTETYDALPAVDGVEREPVIEIVHTRVVYIKDNNVRDFENIDFIVEFVLYSDLYGSSPYYAIDYNRGSSVIFYKDGGKEVYEGNMITTYIATTGDLELTKILKDVEDYGTEYNRRIELD